ncbi:MAG: Gfo/Idh/MocA family protein [Armatimonadota bacterium]
MINVGIIGVGGLGGGHLNIYTKLPNAQVIALCDILPERVQGSAERVATNVSDGSGVAVQAKPYLDFREMVQDPDIDAVDICLPTDLHAETAVAALEAGKHVICEKPMALSVEECDRMIAAAKAADRVLMIAHCIRFWPEYVVLKRLIESGQYGKLRSASFQRLSGLPTWSESNWMADPKRSGGSILDLHIHDADYIHYLLGLPKYVTARGVEDQFGISQLTADYYYDDGVMVNAAGSWFNVVGFPFHMTFLIWLEQAVIEMDGARAPLTIYPVDGDPIVPELPEIDGYVGEIAHFLDCIEKGIQPQVVTAWDSRESIRLVMAEQEAVRTGKRIAL